MYNVGTVLSMRNRSSMSSMYCTDATLGRTLKNFASAINCMNFSTLMLAYIASKSLVKSLWLGMTELLYVSHNGLAKRTESLSIKL